MLRSAVSSVGHGLLERALIRPFLLIWLNPTRLVDVLQQNANVVAHQTAGRFGPYTAHTNNFVPFETSKYQFMSLLSFSRSVSALFHSARAARALQTGDAALLNEERAAVVGETLADSIDLLRLSSRYGGGLRRLQLAQNALVGAWNLFGTVVDSDPRLAVALQTMRIADVFPMWFLAFSKQRTLAKVAAVWAIAVNALYAVPTLARLLRNALKETKRDRKLDSLVVIGLVLVFKVLRTLQLAKFVLRRR